MHQCLIQEQIKDFDFSVSITFLQIFNTQYKTKFIFYILASNYWNLEHIYQKRCLNVEYNYFVQLDAPVIE